MGDEIAVKEDVAEKKPDAKTEAKAEAKAEAKPTADAKTDRKSAPQAEAKSEAKAADPKAEAKSEAKADLKDVPAIQTPAPTAEPWPDATPTPMNPVEPGDAVRQARTQTVTIPAEADLGRPPDMPKTSAPPPLALGAVEDPTHMPGPKDVPNGNPGDPAPPPGRVPPGDSRSLRRANEFALVYRVGTCVITRTGSVGTRGQWRVVEYPTTSFASNSYAKECSRFVSEGFSDYRE
ncbi:MAG: hypothetical protein HOV81_27000 [Kofleriaceae bacterium]|nr:hypothetical protein [Kofleriaceae bacterium]